MRQSEFSRKYIIDIESHRPEIIEYFVAHFGEKYREQITQRLNDVVVLFACENDEFIKNSYHKLSAEEVASVRQKQKEGELLVAAIEKAQREEIGAIMKKVESLFIKNKVYYSKKELDYLASLLEGSVPANKEANMQTFITGMNIMLPVSIYDFNKDTKIAKGKTLGQCFESVAERNMAYLSTNRDSQAVCEDSYAFLESIKSNFAEHDYNSASLELSFFDTSDSLLTPKTKPLMGRDKKPFAIVHMPYIERFMYDNILIHELVHAVQAGGKTLGKGVSRVNSGFCTYIANEESGVSELAYSDQKARYLALINEILTDRSAVEIAYNMSKNGLRIVNNTHLAISGYANAFTALKPLIERFGDKIHDYTMQGKIDEFVDLVGEENLFMLAEGANLIIDASDDELREIEWDIARKTGKPYELTEEYLSTHAEEFKEYENFKYVKGYMLTNRANNNILQRLDEKKL